MRGAGTFMCILITQEGQFGSKILAGQVHPTTGLVHHILGF
jgi:hypothetical protein